jgi:CRISPR-associated protein (TIGR02584 family)
VTGPEVVLLAVTGMSPAILTETIWALAHPAAGSDESSVIPQRVIVLTTSAGRREIESGLFAPLERFGGITAWDSLRTALQAEGFNLEGRLRFGTTADDIRVFTTTHRNSGRSTEMEDIRTPADNEAAANFMLEQVRGLVEDPDKQVIASLAGGRKTMSALLYACFSLVGRETDRLTHVLVGEPYDQIREFYYPGQPGGAVARRDGSSCHPQQASVELADVPFVPLRQLFRRELGHPAGGFMRLVESCQAGVRKRIAENLRLTVWRSRTEIEVQGTRLPLAHREHMIMLFLAARLKDGEPALSNQKDAVELINDLRTTLRSEAPQTDLSDWRHADSLKSDMDDQDLRRALSSLRSKILNLGGEAAALASCLPAGRGRFALDATPAMIFLAP